MRICRLHYSPSPNISKTKIESLVSHYRPSTLFNLQHLMPGFETIFVFFAEMLRYHRPSPLSSTHYCWDQSGQQQSLIVLPKIKNMSELSLDTAWSCTLRHPSDSRSYPLIHSRNNPIRIRNLALGGPFQ